MRFANVSLALAAAVTVAAIGATRADAACTRLGFSVNDYGKDGPTKDAKELLDKHIAKTMADKGIKSYRTGPKDVKCDLYLNLILFDEHTCKASATVCWDGSPLPKGEVATTDGKPDAATGKSAAEKPAKAVATDKAKADKPAKAAVTDKAATDKPATEKAKADKPATAATEKPKAEKPAEAASDKPVKATTTGSIAKPAEAPAATKAKTEPAAEAAKDAVKDVAKDAATAAKPAQ